MWSGSHKENGTLYALIVPPGTYDVTASKQPTHTDNTTLNVPVTALTISYANIKLDIKSMETITGTVTIG